MVEYNSVFFQTVENAYLIAREWEGEEYALRFLNELFSRGLKDAYALIGAKRNGGQSEFKRCVGERDAAVGLVVSFEVLPSGFAYRFHVDPFPGLKGKVLAEKLDGCYLDFKKNFFLGRQWTFTTTKHLWKGDSFTEHVFKRL